MVDLMPFFMLFNLIFQVGSVIDYFIPHIIWFPYLCACINMNLKQ